MTTTGPTAQRPTWRTWVRLAGFFAGLCVAFGLLITAIEAWQEHGEAQWPEVTARIDQCSVDLSPGSQPSQPDASGYYLIECGISYQVSGENVVTKILSRSRPQPNVISRDPWAEVREMQDWVDTHPEGTPLTVHYDPRHPGKAALVATDMPMGGPRTPSNLRLLGIIAAIFGALLVIARF